MSIPREVLSDTLRRLLAGRRVKAGLFTTYTFEPQFFEEEIVSLLSDEAFHTEPKLRMLQLEELLNSEIGPLTVYYDRSGLRGDGAARLDVRYIPVHVPNGVFHPKIVLLLTTSNDPAVESEQTLICGILSSNLTKGGWWSLLECAHFETVTEGSRCSFKKDLQGLLRDLGRVAGPDADREALELIAAFANGLDDIKHDTLKGQLRPRIVAGTRSLTSFLSEVRQSTLKGTTLEVISPFFDEHKAAPLRELVHELEPQRTFVFLPRGDDGVVACAESVYKDALTIPGVKWAQFREEDSLLRLGKDKHAKRRSVHAKVYRFTHRSDNYEALVIGSHNLTTPAVGRGRNFEASFFLEVEPQPRVEPWLEWDDKMPRRFNVPDPAIEAELPRSDVAIPLQVKFDWAPPESCRLLWEGSAESGALRLELKSSQVFECESLSPGRWKTLLPADTAAVRDRLVSSALLTVRLDTGDTGMILVQEVGMYRKPPILLTLSPAEVLAYWARLTPGQRSQYWEERLNGFDISMLTSEGLELPPLRQQTSMFETYAGIFHGFEMLRERLSMSLKAEETKQARHLLFGDRHESLPRLLRRVQSSDETNTEVISRYLIILSARQLLYWLKKEHREFLDAHQVQVAELQLLVQNVGELRSQLNVGPDHAKFLNWFEGHFVRRTRVGAARD